MECNSILIILITLVISFIRNLVADIIRCVFLWNDPFGIIYPDPQDDYPT